MSKKGSRKVSIGPGISQSGQSSESLQCRDADSGDWVAWERETEGGIAKGHTS